MENLKTILGILAIFVVLPVLILLLNDRLFHRTMSKSEREEYARRIKERMLNPDFAAVEAALGCPVPEELKKLYADKEEIMRGDFEVRVKPPADSQEEWSIAFYLPADQEAVDSEWPDCKQYFSFADDGCGNRYLIDPRAATPEVMFHDHETGEFTRLGVGLAEFLAAPRVYF